MLRVADPCSGAHHLDVAGKGPANVARVVFMGGHALADIRDDLHVGMAVQAEPGAGGNFVIVPDDKGAERRM